MRRPTRDAFAALLLATLPVACNRPRAPIIARQPESRTAAPGRSATFHVVAAGSPPLRYDWRRNGVSLGAPSLDTYTTPELSARDDGAVFAVVVANAAGATVSHSVRLQVHPAPHETKR
jgi:hypothetical protein